MDEIELHSRKNRDYAFGGDPLGNFQRRRVIFSQYPGLDSSDEATIAMMDMMKQLDAVLWLKSQGHKAGVEGVVDRLRDVGVYAKIAIILEQRTTPVKEVLVKKKKKGLPESKSEVATGGKEDEAGKTLGDGSKGGNRISEGGGTPGEDETSIGAEED